jgi:hypothetical protein
VPWSFRCSKAPAGGSAEGLVVWGEKEVGQKRLGSPVSCITDMQHCAQWRQCTDFRRARQSLTQSAEPNRLCHHGIHIGPKFSMHGSHATPSPLSAMPSEGRGLEQRTGALKGECDPACWAFRQTWNAGSDLAVLLQVTAAPAGPCLRDVFQMCCGHSQSGGLHRVDIRGRTAINQSTGCLFLCVQCPMISQPLPLLAYARSLPDRLLAVTDRCMHGMGPIDALMGWGWLASAS